MVHLPGSRNVTPELLKLSNPSFRNIPQTTIEDTGRRVARSFTVSSGASDFLRGHGPPFHQLGRNTLQNLAEHFRRTGDSRLARTEALINQRFRSEQVGFGLTQQRLAREQGAKRKFDEGVQAQQPDRFNKIIADTKQRDKVRADITGAGFNPAELTRATPKFNLDSKGRNRITTNEAQRKEARRQVGIPI